MKKYELVYIIHPDLENDYEKVSGKVSGFIQKKNGVIIKTDNWGKRKLAYPIKKCDFGVYVVLVFEAETKDIKEIEKNVMLSEEIIRHLLVLHEEGVSRKIEDKTEEAKEGKPKKKAAIEKEEKLELEVEEKKEEVKEAPEKEEKERLKALDDKLEELLGKDDQDTTK